MKRKKHWKFLRLRSTAYALSESKRIRACLSTARSTLKRQLALDTERGGLDTANNSHTDILRNTSEAR